MNQSSKKLIDQIAGPFEVLEQIGYFYKLKLLELIKVHPVFYAEKLCKHSDNPLLGQPLDNTFLVSINDQVKYKVEQILAIKLVCNKLKYKVKWKGWDDNPDQYFAADLANVPLLLQQFYIQYLDKPRLLSNLDYQLNCAQKDVFLRPRTDNNIPKA